MNRFLGVVFGLCACGMAWGQASPSLSLSASPNPADAGQTVTITATISNFSGSGSVTFYDNYNSSNNTGTQIGTVTRNGNTVTLQHSFSSGTHNLGAICCGQGVVGDGEIAGTTTLHIRGTTSLTLSANPNPATTIQTVTVTATVGAGNATGNVTFFDNGSNIGTQGLFGTSANLATAFSAGTHNLTATYNGDNNYDPANSNQVSLQVNAIPSTTTLTTTPNPSVPGQNVALTATVSPQGTAGTVTFFDGATSIGSASLQGSAGTFNTTSLASGPHTLTAVYAGNTFYAGSTSSPVTQNVSGGSPVTLSSISPSTAAVNGSAFTLTLNGSNFFSGAAATWNGTSLSTAFVSSTQLTATVPTSLLASAGTAQIKVANSSSVNFTVLNGQSCLFTFRPASASFGASGGSGSSAVTATRNDCAWTPTASVPWITFTSGQVTGSGQVSFNVGANNGPASRTGAITVGSSTFQVTQGGTNCTFTLPSAKQAFPASGGNGAITVQAPPGCGWGAAGGSPFVNLNGAGGSGDGSVTYSVSANPSATSRFVTLTVANLPYTVIQAGTNSAISCTASASASPTVALEGLTDGVGGINVSCTGFTGPITVDITLLLNTNITNPLNNTINPLLSVNGGPNISGTPAGYNTIRFNKVTLTPTSGGAVSLSIQQVCANGNQLASPGQTLFPIIGQLTIGAGTVIPVSGGPQTMGTATPSLIFSRLQANPPAGGARTLVPLIFQEGQASAFTANSTRLRVSLSNIPSTVQVWAPVFAAEGQSRAQLFSADATGTGGSAVSGTAVPEGMYQQLSVSGGAATATWMVLNADNNQTETWTFPLLLLNASANDLNAIQISTSLAPLSNVTLSSPTAPVPRFRDLSLPQSLTNLRLSTVIKSSGASAPLKSGATPQPHQAAPGGTVTLVSTVTNDTSDPSQTATNVTVQNNLPTGLTAVSCTSPAASCSTSGNQVQVNVGNLGPGQSTTVTVTATVDPSVGDGSAIEDQTSVSSDQVNQDLGASDSSTSLIVLAGGLVAVGGTPAFGTGGNQTFTFQFNDPSGFQNLGVVNILVNSALDGRSACYLAYQISTNTLFLVDDGGDAGGPFAGSAMLGNTSPIQNSQCSVSLTSAVGSGPTLTLMLAITFKPSFGGNKVMFVAARDNSGGNTDWQPLGVWQDPFNSPVSITVGSPSPARGAKPSGQNQQFTLTFNDTNGTGDFGVINILINTFIDGRKACYLAYSAPTNTLFLVDDQGDAGGPFAGSVVLNGGNGGVSNSQCSVSASGSAVQPGSNSLSLTLNVTFTSAFSGNRVIYAAARDRSDGNNTGWQAVGTWTVQ